MKNNKAFTLVELIVVITILSILMILAFLSFIGLKGTVRDSVRLTDTSSLDNSLKVFEIQSGFYPFPSDSTLITYKGGRAWYQGHFGESVIRNLQLISDVPLDPLTNTPYSYSISEKMNKYQIGGILERHAYYNNNLVNQANAENKQLTRAYVRGNYNGSAIFVQTGGLLYVIAIPSIITSDKSLETVEEIVVQKRFVYDGFMNLPHSYKNSQYNVNGGFNFVPSGGIELLIYVGPINSFQYSLSEDQLGRVTLVRLMQSVYRGTILENQSEMQKLMSIEINAFFPSEEAKTFAIDTVNSLFDTHIQE